MSVQAVCSICKEFAVITAVWNETGVCEVCSRNLIGHVRLDDIIDDPEPIDRTSSEPS